MNNGIFVQNLLDRSNTDIGLPRSSLVSSDIVSMPYGYAGDEYWRYDRNKLVLLYDTRYSSNTTVTLPVGNGNAYNIVVDWGDGNINRYSASAQNISYTYKRHGVYLVQISGSLLAFGANFVNVNANKLIKCLNFGSFSLNAIYYAFSAGYSNLIEVPRTIPSSVTQLQNCFSAATKFNGDISSWDTSNVTNMSSLFNGAGSFNQSLDSWNVSNVTDISYMFQSTPYNQPLNSWNTSKLTSLRGTFNGCRFFNQSLSNWDTSKVTDMNGIFSNALVTTAFNQNIGMWNTISAIDMGYMFYYNHSFNNGGLSDINNWNTSNVTSMRNSFQNAISFNQPLNNWNVRKVTTFASMFQGATSFNSSLSGWALGADTSGTSCQSMFQSATSFNQDLSSWDTSKVTNMALMFANINNFNQPIGSWNVSKVTTMTSMLQNAMAFNQDISGWNLAGLNANTSLDSFMSGKVGANALSTANYDALLIGWNNNKLVGANGVANWRTDLRPNFGGAKYTAGGDAATARAALVSYGWTITDGGTA